jgi:glyoxylase-like metal-dependent hydrolase (beta-lactamase superfamily II)
MATIPWIIRALGFLAAALTLAACQPFASGGPEKSLELEPKAVAPGVYCFQGSSETVSPSNRGLVGNSGFIVGPSGVVVIDTGTSRRRGEAILASIRKVTPQPVKLVIITHAQQEFLFGNAAFAARGIPILAHPAAIHLMRSRCNNCLQNLKRELGPELMEGTQLVLPDKTLPASAEMDVGGRSLLLLAFDWASSPGDIAVLDRSTGSLFAGGLVSVQRIPLLQDAKLVGWLDALDQLDKLSLRAIVPSFGPPVTTSSQPSVRRALSDERNYLTALDRSVHMIYEAGVGLGEAPDKAALPEYQDWAGYPELHRKNIHYRYLQLENADLLH